MSTHIWHEHAKGRRAGQATWTAALAGCTALVLSLAAAVGFLSGRMRGRLPALAATMAGLCVVIGFLTWAAAGRDLPFPVSNQFAGTLSLATPLVFGALCGVLCERAGAGFGVEPGLGDGGIFRAGDLREMSIVMHRISTRCGTNDAVEPL